MKPWIIDLAGLGTGLWLIGYLLSLVLFFTSWAEHLGWIITAICTPVTIAVTWWWFRKRDLPLSYFVMVGLVWILIAVILDYLFIVLLFQAVYYKTDVYVYYALIFLIPVVVGMYLKYTKDDHGDPV
jgi:small-conductance mechanosensitive channel